jgi:Transposase DDE domain group 1
MTECNGDSLHFSRIESKAVVADFHGGRLTTDAGVLLLREVAERLGLFDALDRAIPDPRWLPIVVHDQKAMLAQRIIAIALGYEDLNDHQTLRSDPALQLASGKVPDPELPLASPPTLCRLENRIDRKSLVRIAGVLLDQFIAAHPQPPESLILDFDATDDPIHGKQEGRFFHGYYDHYCFLPLYVFCGDELITAYLRPSDIDAAKHTRAVLKLLVRRLRAVWPEVKITIRGDSGFCRWRLMRWCDSNGIGYVLGLAKNPVLQREARDWIERAERQFVSTGQPQRIFGSLSYAAKSWDRTRRVIAKAEHNAQGANPRFVVTNVPGDPQELYEDVYCQRGEMENRIKEQQLGLFADRTSCHRFLANQFRLLLSSAAYVLMQALRREALPGTELARAQVGTIRLKLLKVAARVVVSVRRVVFQLASGYPYRAVFCEALDRLMCRPSPVAAGAG